MLTDTALKVIEVVVSKLTRFQDSEPVVALVGSAQRLGPGTAG